MLKQSLSLRWDILTCIKPCLLCLILTIGQRVTRLVPELNQFRMWKTLHKKKPTRALSGFWKSEILFHARNYSFRGFLSELHFHLLDVSERIEMPRSFLVMEPWKPLCYCNGQSKLGSHCSYTGKKRQVWSCSFSSENSAWGSYLVITPSSSIWDALPCLPLVFVFS